MLLYILPGRGGGVLSGKVGTGCAAQIGCILALQVFQWPLFILKQGFNIGCISTMGLVLGVLFTTGFLYRLQKIVILKSNYCQGKLNQIQHYTKVFL